MDGNIENMTIQLSFAVIQVQISRLGEDYNIILKGGDSPHIGCTVLAIPRPSLLGDGSVSSTASVINVTGHKDEEICRYLAEEICKKKQAVAVCSGGFHVDGITAAGIKEVVAAVKSIAEQI